MYERQWQKCSRCFVFISKSFVFWSSVLIRTTHHDQKIDWGWWRQDKEIKCCKQNDSDTRDCRHIENPSVKRSRPHGKTEIRNIARYFDSSWTERKTLCISISEICSWNIRKMMFFFNAWQKGMRNAFFTIMLCVNGLGPVVQIEGGYAVSVLGYLKYRIFRAPTKKPKHQFEFILEEIGS